MLRWSYTLVASNGLAIFGNGGMLRPLAAKFVAHSTLCTKLCKLINEGMHSNILKCQGSVSPFCILKATLQINRILLN